MSRALGDASEALAAHVAELMVQAAVKAQTWRAMVHGYFVSEGSAAELGSGLARAHAELPGSSAVGGFTAEVVSAEEWDDFADWESSEQNDTASAADKLFRRQWRLALLTRDPSCDGHGLSPSVEEVSAALVEYAAVGGSAAVGVEMSLVLTGDSIAVSEHLGRRWERLDDPAPVCEGTSLSHLVRIEWAEVPSIALMFGIHKLAVYRALVWWRENGLGVADAFDFAALNRLRTPEERSAVCSALRKRYGPESQENLAL